MNKVILMGRLTRNPEIRYSQGDNSMAIARFTLAVDRRVRRDSEITADFISCVAFGKTAEFFDRYMKQGSKVLIEGRIQTGSYTRQDGTKVYTTDVVVENAEFAESKAASGYGTQQQGYSTPQPQQQSSGAPQYQQPQQNYGAPQAQQQSYSAPPAGNAPSYAQDVPQGSAGNSDPGFMQEAADAGFMQIPDELSDEGLPFN